MLTVNIWGYMASPRPFPKCWLWTWRKPEFGLFVTPFCFPQIHNVYFWIYVLWAINLSKVITNSLIFDEGIKIQDDWRSCALVANTKMLVLHYQLLWQKIVLSYIPQNEQSLTLGWVFRHMVMLIMTIVHTWPPGMFLKCQLGERVKAK